MITFAIQILVLYLRARGRQFSLVGLQDDGEGGHVYNYIVLDYRVWISLFVLPVGGLFLGMLINSHDVKFYQRYMQFLRFDFETKLGQYSPR